MDHPNECEEGLLYSFQRRANQYIPHPPNHNDVLEWFAVMQHYGVPTRLLDCTKSPYVALYFALDHESSVVWAIDSGWISDQANHILEKTHDFPGTADERAFNRYLNAALLKRDNPSAVVVAAPLNTPERQAVQQGVFLCDVGNRETFDLTLMRMIRPTLIEPLASKDDDTFNVGEAQRMDASPPNRPVCKIVISGTQRVRFANELYRMNINAASLFPGLDGFGRSLRDELRVYIDQEYEKIPWGLRPMADCRRDDDESLKDS